MGFIFTDHLRLTLSSEQNGDTGDFFYLYELIKFTLITVKRFKQVYLSVNCKWISEKWFLMSDRNYDHCKMPFAEGLGKMKQI